MIGYFDQSSLPPPPFPPPLTPPVNGGNWSFEEEKEFENLIAVYDDNHPNRWFHISAAMTGRRRTAAEVEQHFRLLDNDLRLIESGHVSLPRYSDDDVIDDVSFGEDDEEDGTAAPVVAHGGARGGNRKGSKWTKEEHKLFLMGLKVHGKGDWRSISRNFVKRRSPTQVASHAQKFFARQEGQTPPPTTTCSSSSGAKQERKRTSIHDITQVDDDSVLYFIRTNLISQDQYQAYLQAKPN